MSGPNNGIAVEANGMSLSEWMHDESEHPYKLTPTRNNRKTVQFPAIIKCNTYILRHFGASIVEDIEQRMYDGDLALFFDVSDFVQDCMALHDCRISPSMSFWWQNRFEFLADLEVYMEADICTDSVNERRSCTVYVTLHIENPQDEKALNIALNKATGDWEPTALADLLQDLQLSGYDLGATGFDAAEVDDLFSKVHDKDVHDDDCEIDPEEVQPYVQPGDIWTLGRHRMMCSDSTDEDAVAMLMDGVKANLVVTDPPYNVAYESADGKKIQNDSMADEQFFSFLLAAFRNMAAHMAEGGSAYIFHADTEGLNFRRAFKEAGFHISGVCIWVKNSLVLGRSPYQWQHEPVLFGWLPNGKHKWFSDRKQSTIWNFDKPKRSADHPTMKPIPLLAYPIKNSSAPNAVVMDLFGGSGSTLMACEQTDRICRTMELDPKYATVIVERFHLEYPEQEITVFRDGRALSYGEVAGENDS